MIWNENAECMEREEKEELQLALFQQQVKRVYENVPFYKKKFDEAGFHPDDLKTLDDISKIPFTTKADLREAYPFGLFAVPDDEIIEIHSTSGTTGTPVVSGYTQKDIDIWGECTARAIAMAGWRRQKLKNPKFIRIRIIHRRIWNRPRCKGNGCNRHTNVCRKHCKTIENHGRFPK